MSWRADTVHFTVDSTSHTADGWHTDVVVTPVVSAGGGAVQRKNVVGQELEERHLRLIRQDDELIMLVIEEFLKKAA